MAIWTLFSLFLVQTFRSFTLTWKVISRQLIKLNLIPTLFCIFQQLFAIDIRFPSKPSACKVTISLGYKTDSGSSCISELPFSIRMHQFRSKRSSLVFIDTLPLTPSGTSEQITVLANVSMVLYLFCSIGYVLCWMGSKGASRISSLKSLHTLFL